MMICFVTLAGRGQTMPENVRGCPISKKSSQQARANETGLPQPAEGPRPSEKSPNEPTVSRNFWSRRSLRRIESHSKHDARFHRVMPQDRITFRAVADRGKSHDE